MTSSNAMAGGVALIATWLVGSPAIAQPTDPWIGTWKLNVTRSTFNPGPPPRGRGVLILHMLAEPAAAPNLAVSHENVRS